MPVKGCKDFSSYWPQQIFSVDETGQFGGEKDNRLYITKEEKDMTGFNIPKDQFVLLL